MVRSFHLTGTLDVRTGSQLLPRTVRVVECLFFPLLQAGITWAVLHGLIDLATRLCGSIWESHVSW